jgi:hypothetical protein
MTRSELRQMASPLLESPLLPPNTIEDLRARSRKRRRQHFAVAGGSVASLVLVVLLLVSSLATTPAAPPKSPSLASFIKVGVAVPDSVLDQVGLPPDVMPPTTLTGQPLLTAGGLPAVVYIGAEFCPYCAIQRWGLIVALSRFGSFSSLGQIIGSSSTAPFPNLQSWSFYGSSYTSRYLRFDPAEGETATPVSGQPNRGYTPLQKLSPLQSRVFYAYDGPPYISVSRLSEAIPFLDFGNKFLMIGSNASPAPLEGLSLDQIAGDLSDPASPVARAVDGTADYMIASICSMTGARVPICSSPFVHQALIRMPTVPK